MRSAKTAIAEQYDHAIKLYYEGSYLEALQIFKSCLNQLANDKVINNYIEKCRTALAIESDALLNRREKLTGNKIERYS